MDKKPITAASITYFSEMYPAGSTEVATQYTYTADPMRNAEIYNERRYGGTLCGFDKSFFAFNGKTYEAISQDQLTGEFHRELRNTMVMDGNGERKLRIHEIKSALESLIKSVLSKRHTPPMYLNGEKGAEDQLVFQNGILNLKGVAFGRGIFPLEEFDRNLFTTSILDYNYEPDAGYQEWQDFLLGCTDKQGEMLLQEFIGYALTCRTDRQKILAIIGASRSGKGTFTRIITKMMGATNVGSTNLNTLSNDFGLAPLIGKRLAIIPDAQQIDQRKRDVAKEALLNISGEDVVSINRKHREHLHQPLCCKLLLVGNAIPICFDYANALRNRLMVVPFPHSFAGKEDPTIEQHLEKNLPGIMNWALDGWHRLNMNKGKFTVCEKGLEHLRQFTAAANPMDAFIHECCIYPAGADQSILSDELYSAYNSYCNGIDKTPLTREHFFINLKTNAPLISRGQLRQNQRRPSYSNITLSAEGLQKLQPFTNV